MKTSFLKFTPAVSFLVACDTKNQVDAWWNELSNGGLGAHGARRISLQ
jgi:predicted 3-demethylubiquinone-9 3-methyltransferase (glyoxalase superfamily)